jgi:hypothetical protein
MLLTYGRKNWLLCARCALTATDQAGCLAFHAINMRTREGERCAGAGEGGCGKICWNSHDLLASTRKLNRNPAIAISIHSFKHQRSHKAHAPAGSLSLMWVFPHSVLCMHTCKPTSTRALIRIAPNPVQIEIVRNSILDVCWKWGAFNASAQFIS